MLLLLYLTRDNALFLCLALIAGAWYQGRIKWAVGAAVVWATAMVFLSLATSGMGGENMYKISNIFYLILKVPKNLLYNVGGIQIWNNIHPTVGIPFIKIAIPAWLPLGALDTIGICPWQPTIPLRTITLVLSTFGVLPSVLAFTLIRNFQMVMKGISLWLLVALIFGCSSFMVGVMVSLDIGRQIGYAWPAFWLAAPMLLQQNYQLPKPAFYRLVFFHMAIGWTPWFLTPWLVIRFQDQVPFSIIYVLVVALFFHFLALRELSTLPRRGRQSN